MTDKNPKATETTSIPVETGVISLPISFVDADLSFDEFKATIAEMNHVLSLLSNEDIQDVESEIHYGDQVFDLNITTSKQSALRYAYGHGFLCAYCTVFSSSIDHLIECGVDQDDLFLKAEEIADNYFEIIKEAGGQLCIHFKSINLKQG